MPSWITPSTLACAQRRSSTAGVGLRVSPPARAARVAPTPARRHERVDARADLVGKRHELEPGGGAGVRGEHAPAAGGREDDDAAAARERLRRERRRPLEGLLDGRGAQRAVLATD